MLLQRHVARCSAATLRRAPVPILPRLPGQRCRSFSDVKSSVLTSAGADGIVLPPGAGGASSLAELSERAGYIPRPEAHDERLKPGFRGATKLFIFFLFNAVPLSALLYYLREQREKRSQMSLLALPSSAEDVAAEALRAIRTSAVCFLLQPEPVNAAAAASPLASAGGSVLRVDPHPPEGTAYVPPTEPLPLVPQLERNVLTDIFESPPTSGLGFIHFAVSRSSVPGAAAVAGDRRASLLYVSHARGAYCTVTGQVSVLSDIETRRRYWKTAWTGSFVGAADGATPANIAPAPSAAGKRPDKDENAPPPSWAHSDYLLIRLAVNEVTLHALVDGPDRWQQRRARRVDEGRGAAVGDAGGKWTLVL